MAKEIEEGNIQEQAPQPEALAETAPEAGAGDAMGATEGQGPSDFDYLKSRTGKRHPDMQFADDAGYLKQMRDDADADDARMAEYDKNSKAMKDLFASDPRSADWWNTWKKNKGKSPIAAMVRTYGVDFLRDGLDDPNIADQIEEAEKEYLDRVTESRNYGETVTKNLDKTITMADDYAKQHSLSTDEVDALLEKVFDRYKRIHLGEVTADDLDWVRKAEGYDQAVEDAKAEGETIGRNTKIREQLKRSNSGDGVASLSGTANKASQQGPMFTPSEQEAFQRGTKSTSEAPEVRARQRYR